MWKFNLCMTLVIGALEVTPVTAAAEGAFIGPFTLALDGGKCLGFFSSMGITGRAIEAGADFCRGKGALLEIKSLKVGPCYLVDFGVGKRDATLLFARINRVGKHVGDPLGLLQSIVGFDASSVELEAILAG